MVRIDDLKEVSRAILAKIFKCSGPAINAMVGRGMPQLKSGRYNLFDCVQWRFDEIALAGSKGETREATKWLTRFRRARALREEDAREKDRGELVPVADAREFVNHRERMVRQATDNLGARLAGQLVGLTDRREVEQIVKVEVYALQAILNAGGDYTTERAQAVVDECHGLTPEMRMQNETRRKNFGWEPYWKEKKGGGDGGPSAT